MVENEEAKPIMIDKRLKHWRQKTSRWKFEGFLDGKTDIEGFIDTIDKITKDLETHDLREFLHTINHVRYNDILVKKEKDPVYNFFKEGLLLTALFLNPASPPSALHDEIIKIISKVLNVTDITKIDELKKKVLKKRQAVDKYFEMMYADGYVDQTWDKRKKEKEGAHGIRRDLTFPAVTMIISLYENMSMIAQNLAFLEKSKDRHDIVMLRIENQATSHKKTKKSKSTEDDLENKHEDEILLLHHGDKAVEYLRNKWVMPVIRVPAFSFSDVWKNSEIISKGIESFARKHNMPATVFHKNQIFIPTAHTGTYPVMVITVDANFSDKYLKLLEKNTDKQIEDGPTIFDDLKFVSYKEAFYEMVSQLDFKTLFIVGCKLAQNENDFDKKVEILKTLENIIEKELDDDYYFDSIFDSNQGKSEIINNLKEEFESVLEGRY